MAVKNLPRREAAVLYLRMSSGKQEQSIPAQRSALGEYAEKHGYKIVAEYLDEAISGDDTSRRAGFLRMREDTASGKFSVVLCWDQDRFGRFDPIEGGYWIKQFRDNGVRLETIAQGAIDWTDFAGRLTYLVQQEGKHAYLRDLSRNVTRGLLAKAKEGRGKDSRVPYGYRSEGGEVIVVEEQAEIVKRIFSSYLKPGGSLRSIANSLNKQGIVSPGGKKWSGATIRYVLSTRKYTGASVQGRFATGRYYRMQAGEIASGSKGTGRADGTPIVHDGSHTAIVNQKTFDLAQVKLASNRGNTAHRTARQYAFSGLLRCGDCGTTMVGSLNHRTDEGAFYKYRCRKNVNHGLSACFPNSVRELAIVDCVRRKIEERLFGDETLDQVRKRIAERLRAERGTSPADAKKLRKRIADLDAKIDQGAERLLSVPDKLVATISAKLDGMRQQRDRLQAKLEALPCDENGSRDRDAQRVEEAVEAIKDLRKAFAKANPADLKTLFSTLIERIELSFDHVQGKQRARHEIKGGTIYLRLDPKLSLMLSIPSTCLTRIAFRICCMACCSAAAWL